MPNIRDVVTFMEQFAPCDTAETWDNVGLLVDCGKDAPLTGVLCALDITPPVIREAVKLGCNLIVSHHPVIFSPLRQIASDDAPALLLTNGISALCMHTNLDSAKGGVNDVLADIFQIENRTAFVPFGRVGQVEKMSVSELLLQCKAKINAQGAYYDSGKPVETLAVISGAGGEFAGAAKAAGADCLLTGEMKYHEGLEAIAMGVSFIAAGHFATENPIAASLATRLGAAFPTVCVQASSQPCDVQYF